MTTLKRHVAIRLAAAAAVTALVFAVVGAGVNARAADLGPPSRVTVHYADLDLSRPADTQVLYRRLERASAAVCGRMDPMNLGARERWQHCYRDALQRAVMQVDSPQLLAVHHDRANDFVSAG